MLLNTTADNPYFQTWVGAFLQGLQQSGWSIGQNVRIDTRWAAGNATEVRKHAEELAAIAPDVILAHGDTTVGPLLQATHTVPIVFPVAADPVGAGFVDSLARPGGNATGFMSFEYSLGGKWSCSRRSRQTLRGRQFFGTLRKAQEPPSLPPSRPRRHYSRWTSVRSICATLGKSSAPLRPSRAPRMAV